MSRNEFREAVFQRDHNKCVICSKPAVDPHHILDRKLFKDGGYYLDNGASLCTSCHWDAEQCKLSCETIRQAAKIARIVLPPGLSPDHSYDKWGNTLGPEVHLAERDFCTVDVAGSIPVWASKI